MLVRQCCRSRKQRAHCASLRKSINANWAAPMHRCRSLLHLRRPGPALPPAAASQLARRSAHESNLSNSQPRVMTSRASLSASRRRQTLWWISHFKITTRLHQLPGYNHVTSFCFAIILFFGFPQDSVTICCGVVLRECGECYFGASDLELTTARSWHPFLGNSDPFQQPVTP